MQDDLPDDFLDVKDDLRGSRCDHYLDDRGLRLGDHDLRLDDLNDRLRHQDVRGDLGDLSLLPVADDVDRDFQGLAPNQAYLQSVPKHRVSDRCAELNNVAETQP